MSRPLGGFGSYNFQSEEEEEQVNKLLIGTKVIALDWAKERKLVSVDLETMTVKVIEAPLLGWLEDIVALPN